MMIDMDGTGISSILDGTGIPAIPSVVRSALTR